MSSQRLYPDADIPQLLMNEEMIEAAKDTIAMTKDYKPSQNRYLIYYFFKKKRSNNIHIPFVLFCSI